MTNINIEQGTPVWCYYKGSLRKYSYISSVGAYSIIAGNSNAIEAVDRRGCCMAWIVPTANVFLSKEDAENSNKER